MDASPSTYPSSWENWWASKAARHFNLREPAAAVRRLAPAAGRLSDLFTVGRQGDFSTAYEKPVSVLAYGNYFLPQTYVRTAFIFHELLEHHRWVAPSAPRLLDLGAGSGGATRAVLDRLPATQATLVDRSKLNLSFAREFLTAASPPPALETILADLANFVPPRRDYDLILASFSMGELSEAEQPEVVANRLRVLGDHLAPGGLLIVIEPALANTATALHRARDLLLASSAFHVWAPCLHRQACPLLAEGDHWCHEVRSWTVPPNVNRINNTLRRSVWNLKFSFLVLGQTPPPRPISNDSYFRLVSPVRRETGKFRFRGCTASGAVADYEILRRALDPVQRRQLERMERGTLLQAPSLQALKDPRHYRIASPSDLVP